ncbi:tRNA (guanosine(46)-N7)-methyltransferase TrmB [Mesoplasma photuris]|uniref:tRNA (guanosine(46)-N7)-methyltransferase TrmB n=1 Tax=Mesoplasma photuris TaxID=217731 RepID=UPI0004E0C756|nr:tRNA (guanosine(46)-N7)-methyltransferase TrmB [Mesoplasma photuris]
MRLRNKQWTDNFLVENKRFLIEWKEGDKITSLNSFNNDNKIHLEIGCGKGNFITNHALLNENYNYIGMEKEKTVVGVALKKSLAMFSDQNKEMSNLKYLNNFAEDLSDMFAESSIDKIFLNFSDPWPKAKHFKKRLTYIKFLDIYSKILKIDGEIHIKTDNDGLYAFTLEQLAETDKWTILDNTDDLYKNEKMLEDNIPTEYEIKFHNLGKNINKIIIKNNK